MIDFHKIQELNERIKKNRKKLTAEKDINKKDRLKYKIQIDELKIKIELKN